MKIKQTFLIATTSLIVWIVLICFSSVWSQDYNFNGEWQNMGPNDNPESKRQTAAGIGPVEFISLSNNSPQLMLGGSLKGGLFVSYNGGDDWQNAGSDNWSVSNCGWAEIHPMDDNMWFAVSMRDGFKGAPGDIGKNGGILRTQNKGVTWESVANYNDFNNNLRTIIYGIRFHPINPKKMYALTTQGLYFTEDCTGEYLQWTKVSYVTGKVYDLEVTNAYLCFSLAHQKKWKVVVSEGQKLVPIPEIDNETRPINKITIQKNNNKFYILIDFNAAKDEVWEYDPTTKKVKVIYNKGMVAFGAGYTFGVNPHKPNELWIGNSVKIRKWLVNEQNYASIDNNYHVDVECVAFHPLDPNTIFIGSHGGIFKTEDNGETWSFKSKGFGNGEVHGLSVSTTNQKMMAVGLNHNGSLVRSDWQHNGVYYWKQVNGGDALIPIINPKADSIIYTSNQYNGGGLYFSSDTAKHNQLLHSNHKLFTSGWSMAAKLHPADDHILYFNFKRQSGANKGNVDVVRSVRPHNRDSIEIISNFRQTHQLESYQVYGLFNSEFHPDLLFAYVLSDEKIEGKTKKVHRLYMVNNSRASADSLINEWHELEVPRNSWIGDLEVHPKRWNKLYISYTAGVKVKSSTPDDKGMIYHVKYKKSDNSLARNWDISANIPSATGGKHNIIVTKDKEMFIGTSTAVYYGSKSTLRGGKVWQEIGFNTPNCKVMGLDYQPNGVITVAYDGRGVWQMDLLPDN